MNFLVQCNHKLIPTEEIGWTIIEKARFRNWLETDTDGDRDGCVVILTNGIKNYPIVGVRSDKEISEIINNKDYIPVGTVEYVESHLGKSIKPINIPEELNKKEFMGRDSCCCKLEQIGSLHSTTNFNRFFLKRADRIKDITTGTYTVNEISELIKNKELIGSDFICQPDISDKIISEYRIFVFNGEILGCHQYSGDTFSSKPDEKKVKQMICDYKNCPPAYTLDVAVIDNYGDENTVIIEVHNFISCGLYGFDNNRLIDMLSAAYKFERCEHR